MTIDKTLSEREQRYGDFTDVATTAQALQDTMRAAPGWDRLDPVQRQGLTAISDKIGRILSGDPNYPDNWHDIAGFATIVERRLPAARPAVGASYVPDPMVVPCAPSQYDVPPPPGFIDCDGTPPPDVDSFCWVDVINKRGVRVDSVRATRVHWKNVTAYRVVTK